MRKEKPSQTVLRLERKTEAHIAKTLEELRHSLGEDFADDCPEIQVIEQALRLQRARIARLAAHLQSQR